MFALFCVSRPLVNRLALSEWYCNHRKAVREIGTQLHSSLFERHQQPLLQHAPTQRSARSALNKTQLDRPDSAESKSIFTGQLCAAINIQAVRCQQRIVKDTCSLSACFLCPLFRLSHPVDVLGLSSHAVGQSRYVLSLICSLSYILNCHQA